MYGIHIFLHLQYSLGFSAKSKEVWKNLCERNLVYLLIVLFWVIPVLTMLPKYFETGVKFTPGNGQEVGYMCYPMETSFQNTNGTRVWFTQTQYVINLSNDIFILLIMVGSIFIIWHGFQREVKDNKTRLQGNERGLTFVNTIAKAAEKQLITTAVIICTTYVVLRLPLYIYGRTEITFIPVGLAACVLLYVMQFCTHFVIYAIIQNGYQRAYHDTLRLIFPSCIKELTFHDYVKEHDNTKRFTVSLRSTTI